MMTMQDTLRPRPIRRFLESPLPRLIAGISVFLASAALFGLASLNVVIKRGDKVTVPNIVNKSVVEALDLLSERGLELRKAASRNSSVIPENNILSQDPLPGTVVKEGSPVSVVISLGSRVSVVPNLVGTSLRAARVELNRAGLRVGRISKMHHPGEENLILAQSPGPDRQVDRETSVDMLLSLGPRPREYRMPELVGTSLEKAEKLLDRMGIGVGDVATTVDLKRLPGMVLDQAPAPGSPIAEGATVSLVTSVLHGEGSHLERKFAVFLYQVPYGFWSKSVKIEVADPEGARTIYNEVDEPGASIRVVFGYTVQCTVRVYLDGRLETERIIQ